MSRFNITIKGQDGKRDESAVIGYDKPLRSYFAQAFPDPENEDYLAFWAGCKLEEFPTLEALIDYADHLGYAFEGITESMRKAMMQEREQPKVKSLAEVHGLIF